MEKVIGIIDLKSFYASCECAVRHLDIFKTPLVCCDPYRSESSIVMSVTPYLKERYGVSNVCRKRDLPTIPGMIYAVPEVMINTIISRELNFLTKNLWIYAKASYKSKQKGLISNNFVYKINNDMGSTPYSISPSCIVDLGVRYSHRIMSANVWCYNLLNTNYKLGGDRVPVPQAGRTFLVTISLHL